jgi:hypothetical protein
MVPLIYYITDVGSSFNWDDILSTTLEYSLKAAKEITPDEFPSFHKSSYLLEMVCVFHQYPEMGFIWKTTNPPFHWENKYIYKYHKIYDYFLEPMY